MAFGASSANILNITYLFAPLGTKDLRLREGLIWSGQRDSNPRPPAPKAGALARLRYAPVPNEDRKHILFNLYVNLHFPNKEPGLKALPRADTLLPCTFNQNDYHYQ